MKDCLFLLAANAGELADDSQLYWQQADGECELLDIASCSSRLDGKPVALVLPMELASSFLVSLPTRKTHLMQQALPYAVEDMLAEDVELFHLALGEQLPDGRYRVLAVRRDLLRGCLEQLEDRGLKIAAIYVDADLLPRDAEHVIFLGQRGLMGGAGEARMAFPAQRWSQLKDLCVNATPLQDVENPYRLLAAEQLNATDLARGEFSRRSDNGSWEIWRPASLALGIVVMLFLGFDLGRAWYLNKQGDFYAESSLALYKELFPDDRRIVNLKAQFAAHLSQGAQMNGGFISMMEQAALAISQAKSSIAVMQVDYSENRGDLTLQVKAKDFPELEQLRQRLVDAGMTVQLGSANREEEGISARVVLGRGA